MNSLRKELEERLTNTFLEHKQVCKQDGECCSQEVIQSLGLGVEALFTTDGDHEHLGYKLKKKIVGEL